MPILFGSAFSIIVGIIISIISLLLLGVVVVGSAGRRFAKSRKAVLKTIA
jgi:hypothetical protein